MNDPARLIQTKNFSLIKLFFITLICCISLSFTMEACGMDGKQGSHKNKEDNKKGKEARKAVKKKEKRERKKELKATRKEAQQIAKILSQKAKEETAITTTPSASLSLEQEKTSFNMRATEIVKLKNFLNLGFNIRSSIGNQPIEQLLSMFDQILGTKGAIPDPLNFIVLALKKHEFDFLGMVNALNNIDPLAYDEETFNLYFEYAKKEKEFGILIEVLEIWIKQIDGLMIKNNFNDNTFFVVVGIICTYMKNAENYEQLKRILRMVDGKRLACRDSVIVEAFIERAKEMDQEANARNEVEKLPTEIKLFTTSSSSSSSSSEPSGSESSVAPNNSKDSSISSSETSTSGSSTLSSSGNAKNNALLVESQVNDIRKPEIAESKFSGALDKQVDFQKTDDSYVVRLIRELRSLLPFQMDPVVGKRINEIINLLNEASLTEGQKRELAEIIELFMRDEKLKPCVDNAILFDTTSVLDSKVLTKGIFRDVEYPDQFLKEINFGNAAPASLAAN